MFTAVRFPYSMQKSENLSYVVRNTIGDDHFDSAGSITFIVAYYGLRFSWIHVLSVHRDKGQC